MSTVQGGQGNIVTSGLILNLDAANPRSYPPAYNGTTWFNLASSSFNGTLTNGPTYSTGSGGAIRFDGTDDYVSIPNVVVTGVGFTGTIEVVANVTGSLVNNERTTTNHWEGYFSVNNNYTLFVGADTKFGPPYVYGMTTTITGNPNAINYYVASYQIPSSTGTMSGTLGINGVFQDLSTSIIVDTANGNHTNIDIGRQRNFTYGTSYCSTGNVFLVRIYNRRLNISEMLQNYNATRARFGI